MQFSRCVIVTAKQLVDSSTALTWCSSRWSGVFLLQAAKDSFGFIDTSATSAHIVLFASLGKAFLHSIAHSHNFSTLTTSCARHDGILLFVLQRCIVQHWERKVADGIKFEHSFTFGFRVRGKFFPAALMEFSAFPVSMRATICLGVSNWDKWFEALAA